MGLVGKKNEEASLDILEYRVIKKEVNTVTTV